ncbi:Bug family tripartite tricarboxylate transporter substrate binding protein [Diaphorobacter caeni]|uniref:Bug family tripartite tricarboxylate transporter substrate binding protein n=1 Tax=Diaphorobacter caeni TaxID=2784387 RepID=UPI00389966B3
MLRASFLLSVLLAGVPLVAMGQNASAPMTLVVPYPAGGPLDTSARLIAQEASGQLGHIQVENKPGKGGGTGAELVAKSPHTSNMVLMGAVATHAVNPWLHKQLPYDPLKDFKPLVLVARTPNVLVMNAELAQELNIQSTSDLVKYLKANPERLKYGSGGNGSIGHIAAEMFKSLTNTRMAHVPFQGSSPALKALESKEVALVFDNLASSLPLIQTGHLKALGVTSLGRDDSLPKVPSINSEVPGFNVVTWFGLFAPASLPENDARRFADAFQAAMKSRQGTAGLRKMGIAPEDVRLSSFQEFVESENNKFGFLIKAAKIRIE